MFRAAAASAALLSAALAAPFSSGSLAVLRVGDGIRAVNSSVAFPADIVEINAVTGAILQTIPLPTTRDVANGRGSCTQIGFVNIEGAMTLSADGRYLAVPCYQAPLYSVVINAANVFRSVMRLDANGNLDASTQFTTPDNFRGVATVDGSQYYLAVNTGMRTISHGAPATTIPVNLTTLASLRCVNIFNNVIYVTSGTAPTGVSRLHSAPFPTTAGALTVSAGVIPATTPMSTQVMGQWMDDTGALWVSAVGLIAGQGYLYKYTTADAGATWTVAFGYPKATVSWVNPAGSTITFGPLKSITGYREPSSGIYYLFFATGSQTSGANWLLRYNTLREVFEQVAQAATNFNFAGVAWAPVAPSSTPTPTVSFGSSRSETPTGTSTPTPSITPTGTPSAAPSLCSTAAPAVSFTQGNAVVLRVGSGSRPNNNFLREIFLDEINVGTGERVQSIAIPVDQCQINGAAPTEGYMTRSLDGQALLFACWVTGFGTTTSPTVPKAVGRVGLNGQFSQAATWLDPALYHRSVIAADSNENSVYYLAGSAGYRSVTAGTFNGTSFSVTNSAHTNVTIRQIHLRQTPEGPILQGFATSGVFMVTRDVTTENQAAIAVPGMQATAVTGTFLYENYDTMWSGDYNGLVSINKMVFSEDEGKFLRAPGYPLWGVNITLPNGTATSVQGVRGMTSYTNADGHFMLLFTTYPANVDLGVNYVVSFNTVTGEFRHVYTGCESTELRSVQMAPLFPSPTPSNSPPPTATSTPSATVSQGAPASITPSASGSTSISPSISASRTPSRSFSASPSAWCRPVTSAPTAFAPSSVLVLRAGDGRVPLPSTQMTFPAFLDEVDPLTGAVLQTLALPQGAPVLSPDGSTVLSAGSTQVPTIVDPAVITRSADTYSVVVPGWAAPPYTLPAALAKSILTVRGDATVSVAAVFTSAAAQVRSAATIDGSFYWFSSSTGLNGMTRTHAPGTLAPYLAPTSTTWRGLAWGPGLSAHTLYVANPLTTSAIAVVGGTAGVLNGPPKSSPAATPAPLPGAVTGSAGVGSVVFENDVVLWTADLTVGPWLTRWIRPFNSFTSPWAISRQRWASNFTDGQGNVVSVSGGRSLTGWNHPETGAFHLLFTTDQGLWRYNVEADTVTLVSASCNSTKLLSVARAPVIPSPSPSSTPTATASISSGTTPSETNTGTPSTSLSASPSYTATATRSITPTPSDTATPSSFCRGGPAAAPPVPFLPSSVALLRIGNGRTGLSSTNVGREAFIEEWNTGGGSTPALRQTIALPTGLPVYHSSGALVSAGCVLNWFGATDGVLTRSQDGTSLVLVGFATVVNAPVNASVLKSIVTVKFDGSVTVDAVFFLNTLSPRSAATMNGDYFWVSSTAGIVAVPRGGASVTQIAPAVSIWRGFTWLGSGLYVGNPLANSAVALVGGTAGVSKPPVVSPAPTPYPLPGVNTTMTGVTSIWFSDPLTLWAADYISITTALTLFTRAVDSPTAQWNRIKVWRNFSVVVPPATTPTIYAAGVGLTGWTDPTTGHLNLLFTPSATNVGIVRFNTVTEVASVWIPPCPNTAYRAIALAPVPPTPSITPSNTPSVSSSASNTPSSSSTPPPTPSNTGTPSSSPTNSQTGTPSSSSTGSPTGTPSSSQTGTPSSTSSETGTPSSSSTGTPSSSSTGSVTPSPSQTGTGSSSNTGSSTNTGTPSSTNTNTPSSSATETGTPSPSGTGTGSETGTPSSSSTGTPAATLTPSVTATKSKVALAPTRTRTATRTKTKSRTKTRTRSRTPSKKRKMMM